MAQATCLLLTLQVIGAACLRSTHSHGATVSRPVVTLLVRRDYSSVRNHGLLGHLSRDVTAASSSWAPHVHGTELSRRQLEDLQRHRASLDLGTGGGSVRRRAAKRFGLRAKRFNFGASADGDVRKRARGVLRLEDLAGTEYVGIVGVGTASASDCNVSGTAIESCPSVPEAELHVVYDTGSADFWVASDYCTEGSCTLPGRHRFNHSRSRSFNASPSAERFETEYGSGRLAGTLGTDDVWVGPFRVKAQELGLIAEEHGDAFDFMSIEGIVGLGFTDLAVKTRPVLDNLMAEKFMPRPEFAFFLHRTPSMGGAVLWGEGSEDLGLHEGKMRWFPVVQDKYWSLSLVGFRLGNYSKRELIDQVGPDRRRRQDGALSRFATADDVPSNVQLIVDSGTTYFTAPPRLFNTISQVITAMECTRIHTLPEMVFSLRTDPHNASSVEDLSVPPEVYMVRSWDDSQCWPGTMMMAAEADMPPMMILGEVFMRHYFSVFRRGEGRGNSWIGFAPAKRGPEVEQKLLLAQQ